MDILKHNFIQLKDKRVLKGIKALDIILGLAFISWGYLLISRLPAFQGLKLASESIFIAHILASGAFFLIREIPKATSVDPIDIAISFCGTFSVSLMQPSGDMATIHFIMIQVLGSMVSFWALLSLGRSIGIVPARRNVKTGGAYSIVRHPMYAGYFLTYAGYLAANPTHGNIIIYMLFAISTLIRVEREEGFLSEDISYKEFTNKVRYRLIPGVW